MANVLTYLVVVSILYGSAGAVQNITCTTYELKDKCDDNCCWEEVDRYIYCCIKDTVTETEAVAYAGVAVVSFVFLVLLLTTVVYFTCWNRLTSKPLDDGIYPMKMFHPTCGVVLKPHLRPQARYTRDYDEVNMHSQSEAGATGYTAPRSMAEVNMG